MALSVKSLPAMQETWVRSLGWKDPLEEGKAPRSKSGEGPAGPAGPLASGAPSGLGSITHMYMEA